MKVALPGFHLSPTLSSPFSKILFTVISALVILAASIYIFSHKQVSVRVDGRAERLVTRATTVEQLLAQADVNLSSHDEVKPPLDTRLHSGTKVTVNHAVPVVVAVNGKKRRIWSTAGTVGGVIEDDLGINLNADVKLNPDGKTRLAQGQTIELHLLSRWIEKVQTEIPFDTKRQDNSRLAKGRTQIIKRGQPGVREKIIEHVRAGNREIETIVRSEQTVSEPVAQVLNVGTMVARAPAVGSPGVKVSRGGRSLTMVATAYASGTDGVGWRTATGTGVYKGIVAVDPRVIPLGTKLYIDGYGPAVAADTGGAIKGNRIDLGFGSGGEAIQFGRRSVVVHVQ